jgi:hypothetical protein
MNTPGKKNRTHEVVTSVLSFHFDTIYEVRPYGQTLLNPEAFRATTLHHLEQNALHREVAFGAIVETLAVGAATFDEATPTVWSI